MSSSPPPQQQQQHQQPQSQPPLESKTHRLLRNSTARTEEANLPFPLRWIVELIQRLIAVMFIVIANAVKMVFSSGNNGKHTHGGRHQMEAEAKRALGHPADKPLEARDLLPKMSRSGELEGKED